MPPSSSYQPTKLSRFRSFLLRLFDLPDDEVQRLINSQLITTGSPSTVTSASQTHLLRYSQSQQYVNLGQATNSTINNSTQILNPPSQSSQYNRNRYTKTATSSKTIIGSEPEVRFVDNNQNSVYCVSSVNLSNLSRLAYEDQQPIAGGRPSSSAQAVPLVGSVNLKLPPEVPTPTQLTIAAESGTKVFTTRPTSYVDKKPQRPRDNRKFFFQKKKNFVLFKKREC